MAKRTKKGPKKVETLTHDEASRKNIPTAEMSSMAQRVEEGEPFEPVTYGREDPLAEGGAGRVTQTLSADHLEAWETLYRDVSRPFVRPSTGRFAVKVINRFGDEVMKVFGV